MKRNISANKVTHAAKKVFVGMSGGVDSSVSAALLSSAKNADGSATYNVTGVFIKVWQPDWINCTWREDRLDAMRVAAKLGIEFVTLDLEKEYKQHVVDYMIAEYKAGRTPNPDVMCNTYVKFGGFFDWAMEQGKMLGYEAQNIYVATGHYAQIRSGFDLVAGNDTNKDQSYFLWSLTQAQLSQTIFPVGNIEKPQVRALATRLDLPTANKKDSQGLCFIGKIDIKEFLSHYIEPKKGDVLLADRSIKIGNHDGAFFFTIGERHGFLIDDTHKTPNDEPYYVIAKDIAKNTITVSHKAPDGSLPNAINHIRLTGVNWTRGRAPASTIFWGRPRYRAPLVALTVHDVDEKARTCKIEFTEPQSTLSSGQSLVIYDSNRVCLGGGIIE